MTAKLIGHRVRFDGPHGKGCQKCGNNVAVIGEGKGEHFGELLCINCNSHCGWMSRRTAEFVAAVAKKFGAPDEPIVLRRECVASSTNRRHAGTSNGEL